MTVIYYITLIVICFMIYDLSYNRKEGFQHRGGEIIPTPKVKEDTGSRTTIIDNTFWTTYVVSESLAKLIILFPYNAIRSIINIITSLLDYVFDMIKVMTDMLRAMIKPIWLAVKKIYDKMIEVFKKGMETIRDLPRLLKDMLKVQIDMITQGIDMFVGIMESFAKMLESAFSKLADIPKSFFDTANMAMELGLAMFLKGMDIPQKMLEMSITMTNKI